MTTEPMTDEELRRLETLLSAAREINGCSDHVCDLRIFPRGGMGTNGGCHCVDRSDSPYGSMVWASRSDIRTLLDLARRTPALVAEVRRLRSEILCLDASVMDLGAERDALRAKVALAEVDLSAMRDAAGGHRALLSTVEAERDAALAEVKRLKDGLESMFQECPCCNGRGDGGGLNGSGSCYRCGGCGEVLA